MKNKELTVKNNWENYSFYYGDSKIKYLYSVDINGLSYNVIRQEIYNIVYDHGHQYGVTSYTFKIIADVGRVPVEIDIRDFIGRAMITITDADVEYEDE